MGIEQKSASMGSGECDSGDPICLNGISDSKLRARAGAPSSAWLKRTSVREPKVEPEACRQIPAQRRADTPFGRTEYFQCFSKII